MSTPPLKPLSREAIGAALAKAERYRLLNEPTQAESICRDVLAVEPDNHQALIALLLALSDQFDSAPAGVVAEARALLVRLADPYERAYYEGIVCERRAHAALKRTHPGVQFDAYEWLTEALAFYEKAEAVRPRGNDDAVLRYNSCVRVLAKNKHLVPRPVERTAVIESE